MLKIHQSYIKKKKVKCFLVLVSIGVFLLGSLIAINAFSETSAVQAAEIKYMQQFTNPICESMSPGGTMNLIDPRGESEEDFQTYKIVKMLDNTCWMAENLRLGNDTTKLLLTSDNTDLKDMPDGWSLPASYESEHSGSVWNDGGYNEAMVKTGKNLGSNYKTAYGNYYSWCAATAGSCMNGSIIITRADAPSSICPRGWKLPTSSGSSSFQNIYNMYPNNASRTYWLSNQSVPYNGSITAAEYNGKRFGANSVDALFPAAGVVIANGLGDDASSFGYYWSRSAHYSETSRAYLLSFSSSDVRPQTYSDCYYGASIRCVADPTVTESDFTYGDIEWSESKNSDVTVTMPSVISIDAVSGMDETADTAKVIDGTATATISSNAEYNISIHSTQPLLKDSKVTTAEISPVSSTNPVKPGNNAWGYGMEVEMLRIKVILYRLLILHKDSIILQKLLRMKKVVLLLSILIM